jgi:hypothetical protein
MGLYYVFYVGLYRWFLRKGKGKYGKNWAERESFQFCCVCVRTASKQVKLFAKLSLSHFLSTSEMRSFPFCLFERDDKISVTWMDGLFSLLSELLTGPDAAASLYLANLSWWLDDVVLFLVWCWWVGDGILLETFGADAGWIVIWESVMEKDLRIWNLSGRGTCSNFGVWIWDIYFTRDCASLSQIQLDRVDHCRSLIGYMQR